MSPLTVLAIVTGVLLLLALLTLLLYNSLVRARNMVDESWSGVDVQLKRRRDLVPNLVQTVQGYADHERKTLESVTAARVAATEAGSVAQAVPAENLLTAMLGQLMAIAENYPDLKASDNFLDLQNQLSNIESQIASARVIYNSNARSYNDKIQSFPNMIVAKLLDFGKRTYFVADSDERKTVTVGF